MRCSWVSTHGLGSGFVNKVLASCFTCIRCQRQYLLLGVHVYERPHEVRDLGNTRLLGAQHSAWQVLSSPGC